MYFIQQIRIQFCGTVFLSVGPEGGDTTQEELLGPRIQPEIGSPSERDILGELSDVSQMLGERFRSGSREYHELDVTIAQAERQRFEERLIPTQSEMTTVLGREFVQGETPELSAEERQTLFETRLEVIEATEIPHDGTEHGPRRILEGTYIRDFAQEQGINPELLIDLRAMDFDGAQSWEEGDIVENYTQLAEQAQRLAEEEGVDISKLSAEEFMRLHELRSVDPMSAPERESRDDVIADGRGGYQIDPTTPGLRTTTEGGDPVQVLPDGTYSRGGDVYSPPPGGSEAFPNYDGPAGEVDENPGNRQGEFMVREETLGTQRLAEVYEQLSIEDKEQIDKIMAENAQPLQMFPIAMAGGSLEFISNPTYAPDVNGDGVSSNEAVAYAQGHSLQLPTRAQTDAAREQAQVRGRMEPQNNQVSLQIQRQNTATQRAYIEQTISSQGGVLVGGLTKIWAFEPGRQPGLNGGIRDIQSGSSWQGYSTVHGPDYADYSQAGQFVHPLRINTSGAVERRGA